MRSLGFQNFSHFFKVDNVLSKCGPRIHDYPISSSSTYFLSGSNANEINLRANSDNYSPLLVEKHLHLRLIWVNHLMYSFNLLLSDTFKFLISSATEGFLPPLYPTKANIKYRKVNREDDVTISCQTNDPNAVVSLDGLKYNGAHRLVQSGQNFTIKNVTMNDRKTLTCRANNGSMTIRLKLGSLLVRIGEFQRYF